MRAAESILISEAPEQVFATVSRVQDYGLFCPRYRGTRVLEESEGKVVLEREARIGGFDFVWVSEATVDPAGRVNIQQLRGPLKGMRTEWSVEPQGRETKVSITHDLALRPPLNLLGGLVYRLIIRDMARTALAGLKSHLEDAGAEERPSPHRGRKDERAIG